VSHALVPHLLVELHVVEVTRQRGFKFGQIVFEYFQGPFKGSKKLFGDPAVTALCAKVSYELPLAEHNLSATLHVTFCLRDITEITGLF